MNRIDARFAALRRESRKALVAYLCIGDPSLDESVDLALACVEAGADILELGVPFSDPTADGPAIARASQRAIARGGGLDGTLAVARRVRAATDVPIVLFGYCNPLYVRGLDRAVAQAAEAGVDALLVVDLPIDEADGLRASAAAQGLHVVPLLAPTSIAPRRAAVAEAARRYPGGFVYYVSVAGVTGNAEAPLAEASRAAEAIRNEVGLPTVVGFGIDGAGKARAAAERADGVVVGTALVRRIEEGATAEDRRRSVVTLVRELRDALDRTS